ncbi:acetylglutamate kinase [Alphaproteobacteria bacterium]|jgi:acetylglutamate kinase|nr:acetylglutamate kinase [Alphaproteobacteria bacterium]MDG1415173.1 acetylglutamate kinase [Alphaproteobacteria bacterium]
MTEMSDTQARAWLDKAETLREALPFMRRYTGKTIVVKFGGHAMVDPALTESFAADIALLRQVGMRPIVVHGGGPQIAAMLERLAVPTQAVDGLRVTDAATMEIVEMVLSGKINKDVVTALNKAGGTAVGLSGKDGRLLLAEKVQREDGVDLGFVGQPKHVNTAVIEAIRDAGLIPVIAPVGVDEAGQGYNINADTAAGAIAAALKAERLIMLTDVDGVKDLSGALISEIRRPDIAGLIKDGTVSGGMIPKLEMCAAAVTSGVGAAVIQNGTVKHVLLLELLTEYGAGTLVS